MNQNPAPVQENSSSPAKKSKTGCIIAAIGCGVLIIVTPIMVGIILTVVAAFQQSSDTKTAEVQNVATTNVDSTEPPPPVPSENVPAQLSMVDALKIAYPEGTYASSAPQGGIDFDADLEGGARWRDGTLFRDFPLEGSGLDENTPNVNGLIEYETTVNDVVTFQQKGKHKALAILDSRPVGTPTFTPRLGGAVLAWDGTRWILESRNEFSEISTDGESIPIGKLINVGPDLYGYRIEYGWMNQGIVDGMTRLIAQNPDGTFVEFNDLYASGTNEGADLGSDKTYSFNSQWEFIPTGDGDYHSLKITWSGTCPKVGGGVANANLTTTYQKCDECSGFEPSGTDIYQVCDLGD